MLVMLVGMLLIRDLQKYTQVKNRNPSDPGDFIRGLKGK